jgi:chromosome segregation ATPase
VNCGKFVVNMFKAGSGKCRDCGQEWHQHEGVIDRQVAEKFIQIWNHNQQKLLMANQLTQKTEEELRAEEKRAYIASQKQLNAGSGRSNSKDWLSGDQSGSEDHKSKHRSLSDDSSEEDFKFYSKEEFLKANGGMSGLPTGASSTPIAKPVKVVNLLDFSETSFVNKPVSMASNSPRLLPLGGSASPRISGLTGSSSPRLMGGVSPRVMPPGPLGSIQPGNLALPLTSLHLRQSSNGGQSPRESFDQQTQLLTGELKQREEMLVEKTRELEIVKHKLQEQELISEKNKEESRKLLDLLDAAMRSNTDTVHELQDQLALKDQQQQVVRGELDILRSEVTQLKEALMAKEREVEGLRQTAGESEKLEAIARELEEEKVKHQWESRLLEAQKQADEELRKASAESLKKLEEERESHATQTQNKFHELRVELEELRAKVAEGENFKAQLEEGERQLHEERSRAQELEYKLASSGDSAEKAEWLTNQLELQASENRALQVKLESLETKLMVSKQTNEELQAQISHQGELELRNEELVNEISNLAPVVAEASILRNQVSDLQAKSEAFESVSVEVDELRSQVLAEKARCEDLESRLAQTDELKVQLVNEQARVEALESQLVNAREVETQLNAERLKVEELKAKLGSFEGASSVEVDELKSLLESERMNSQGFVAQVAELESLIGDLRSQLSQQSDEKERLVSELEALRIKSNADESSIQLLNEELLELRQSGSQANETLVKELELSRAQSERKNIEIAELTDKIDAIETELKNRVEKDQEILILREEMAAIKSAHTQSHEYIAQLETELESARGFGDIKRGLEAEIAGLQDKLALSQAAFSESLGEIENKLQELRNENTQLLQRIAEGDAKFEAERTSKNDVLKDFASIQVELQTTVSGKQVVESELQSLKTQMDSVEMHLTSAQLRLEEESKLRHQVEESRGSTDALVERITQERDGLKLSFDEVREELENLRKEKETIKDASREKAIDVVALESSLATAKEEIETLRASLMTTENELKFIRSQLSAESDVTRAEAVRFQTELEAVREKLTETQNELSREVQNGVSAQARVLQAERNVEELRTKLELAENGMNQVTHNNLMAEENAKITEQYLRAIQDASFVMKTVSDKFLSPNPSEAQSRAISVEEEGMEAVAQLDRHVKSLLRLVEAVSDKAKILERENNSLEHKLRDYESINLALREKANQSLVNRLLDPIISCKWPTYQRARFGSSSSPTTTRTGGEMSQLIAPPRQYGGMSP